MRVDRVTQLYNDLFNLWERASWLSIPDETNEFIEYYNKISEAAEHISKAMDCLREAVSEKIRNMKI